VRRRPGDVGAEQRLAAAVTGFQHVNRRADAVQGYAKLGQDPGAVRPQRYRGTARSQVRRLLEDGDLVAVGDQGPRGGESADSRPADQHLHERSPSGRVIITMIVLS
jgi:hypothetical protein